MHLASFGLSHVCRIEICCSLGGDWGESAAPKLCLSLGVLLVWELAVGGSRKAAQRG